MFAVDMPGMPPIDAGMLAVDVPGILAGEMPGMLAVDMPGVFTVADLARSNVNLLNSSSEIPETADSCEFASLASSRLDGAPLTGLLCPPDINSLASRVSSATSKNCPKPKSV
jgi:hypothetical protein